jgi:hypothetical protein
VSSGARLSLVVAAASLLALGRPASAEVRRAPQVLRLQIAAAEPVMAAVVDRLRARLGAMGVELVARLVGAVDVDAVLATPPASGDGAPLAQVWLDGRSSGDAVLILVPRSADRVLARRIASGAVFDEVALAEIVFVIERATASLLASRPVGVPKAEVDPELWRRPIAPAPILASPPATAAPTPSTADPPEATPPESRSATPPAGAPPGPPAAAAPPAEPPPADVPAQAPPPAEAEPPAAAPTLSTAPPASLSTAPPASRSRASWQVAAFAGAESWATGGVFVPDYGAAVLFERVTDASHLGFSIDGQLRGAVDVDTSFGKVELSGGGAHLFLSYGRAIGPGTGRVALGPGLAVSDVRATPASNVAVGRPRTDVDWTLAALLRWDLPVARALTVFGAVGVDVAPNAGRYTAVVNGASTPLLTTWPVRPALRLGLALGR